MKKEDARFYVYEWYNKDSGEVFYVGKGTNGRYKSKTGRNKYFLNYCNKHNCDVRKIKENMKEDEAFKLEIEMIKKYKDVGLCKCNMSEGGEGSTFPEGSKEWYIQKINSIKNFPFTQVSFDKLPNEFEYDDLHDKTLEELKFLYENFYYAKSNYLTNGELSKYDPSQTISELEYIYKNQEWRMFFNLIFNQNKSHKKFSKIFNTSNKAVRLCELYKLEPEDLDELLNLFKCKDIYYEFLNDILYLLRSIKELSLVEDNKFRSFRIEDNFLHIKFNSSYSKNTRVKISIDDIILTMIEEPNINLSNAIIKNFMIGEIYKN